MPQAWTPRTQIPVARRSPTLGRFVAAVRPRELGAQSRVPVEDRVSREERDDAPESEERAQRDGALPRRSAVADDERESRDEGREEADEQRNDDAHPEAGAEQR